MFNFFVGLLLSIFIVTESTDRNRFLGDRGDPAARVRRLAAKFAASIIYILGREEAPGG